MYLDYAELQAAYGRVMTMKDWVGKTQCFSEIQRVRNSDERGENQS